MAKELSKGSIKFIKEIIEKTEGQGKYRSSEKFCDLVEKLAEKHGFDVVGEGTNRIIVENDKGNVLKIAHSKMGFIDNRFEELITKNISTYSPKVKHRFAKTICHNIDSSLFIEQKKEVCITDIVDEDSLGKKSPNAVRYLLGKFDDYLEMIKDVSKYYFLSDVFLNRPRNIGENENLLIIDYGYLIPLNMLEGIELDNGVRVVNGKMWCSCATDKDIEEGNKDKMLKYYVPNIPKMLKDAGIKKGGKASSEIIEKITNRNNSQAVEKYVCKCDKKFPSRMLHESFIDALFEDEKKKDKKKKK